MDYQKIGSFIAEKRKEKNLTQKELAKQIGVTDKAVSKWERGLGCPDVSILEPLSKILDISVLDILNGYKTTEEFMNTNNVKKCIENTVNYSKEQNNRYKSLISKVLAGIILTIGLMIIVLNLISMKNLSEKIYYDFNDNSNVSIANLKDIINELNNNIVIVENNRGIYSDDEYNAILDSISIIKDSISRLKLLNYYNDINFLKETDLFIISQDILPYGPVMALSGVLSNYDSRARDWMKIYADVFLLRGSLGEIVYDMFPLYYYQIDNSNFEIDLKIRSNSYYKISSIFASYMYTIDVYNYLLSYIIEVGEIYA